MAWVTLSITKQSKLAQKYSLLKQKLAIQAQIDDLNRKGAVIGKGVIKLSDLADTSRDQFTFLTSFARGRDMYVYQRTMMQAQQMNAYGVTTPQNLM